MIESLVFGANMNIVSAFAGACLPPHHFQATSSTVQFICGFLEMLKHLNPL